MDCLTMERTADYLNAAIIDHTINVGHALIHIGTNAAGARFVLVNDWDGKTVVTESP